jgi:hypothetical protein
MIVALNMGMQALAVVFLLPILAYMLKLLVTCWTTTPRGINATRVMIAVWAVSLIWVGFYRNYYWYYVARYGEVPSWNDLGGLSMSAVIFLSALVSLVAFVLRNRAARPHINPPPGGEGG